MLRRNIDTNAGFVNGAIGTVPLVLWCPTESHYSSV